MSRAAPAGQRGIARRALGALDRGLGIVIGCALVLVLPVSLLLFLQWPLRELVAAYSREANDLAQLLFALYVAAAISYASRRHVHLAADAFAHRYPARVRARLARIAGLVVLAPWSLFILYTAWPVVAQSVAQLESFPETYNPGYFLVKVAVALLAALVLLQSVVAAFGDDDGPGP